MSKLLRYEQVRERVGYSRQHLGQLEKKGLFPLRIAIGPKSVAWLESEIDEWINSKRADRGAVERPCAPRASDEEITDPCVGDDERDRSARMKNARLRQQPSVSL
jgi:prophage regulatory protein